jgi:cysteine desulfurase
MNYLDYAASSPLDEDAAKIYVKIATQHFGNSNSLHDYGEEARQLLEGCRTEFSNILGVESKGVYFTSGGSESNFLAIEALLSSNKKQGKHCITTVAEHSSVHSCLDRLKQKGYQITYLPFNHDGLIDVNHFVESIREDTVLAVIQHGNSEIGTIQPIVEIGKICRENNILFHSDCVQTFGKLNLKIISSYVDSLSISGHKFYGPKGTGLAYLRPQLNITPYFPNTTHEKGFRPGTVNVPGIVAMTIAAKKINDQLDQNHRKYVKLRNTFIKTLQSSLQSYLIHGCTDDYQIPSIIGMRLEGIEGQWVMNESNLNGFAISTGSACHTGMLTPALSMTALGFTDKKAKEYFRISMGRDTTEEMMVNLAQLLVTFTR